jgi:2'-5' RNA ligase
MIHEPGQAKARPTLRLFTGIAVPPDILSRLDELVRRLKPLASIRWSPASNFHITTKFIGAWPQERLEEMRAALGVLKDGGAFKIAIRGLGFFPNASRPRIFWTGVEGGATLATLASRTDQACAKLGVEPEKKPYSPHLTLARIDSPSGLATLHDALHKLPAAEFGEFDATAFHLYLSQPGHGGSIYTSLAEFPL